MKTILPNPWLSDFFGRAIIEAKVAASDDAQIRALQQQGFQFVEGEIDFCLEFAKFQKKTTACTLATEADIAALEVIVGFAFVHSRFRMPWFSEAENQRFYRTWIRNAVKGEFDDVCLILRAENGDIQGGVSVRLNSTQARVGLLVVAPNYQGQGLAKVLLHGAADWAIRQGAERLFIATQMSNVKAINLYQKLGAMVVATNYWFYREATP